METVARFNRPVSYIFNKSNNDVLENICFIFIFLNNNTDFIDKNFSVDFMNDIYLKKWNNLCIEIYNYSRSDNKKEYNTFKNIIELNGIKFLKLKEIYEYLIEN